MRYSNALMNRLLDHVLHGATMSDEDSKVFKRIKVAYAQIIEHYSERVALQHLKAIYGDEYSDSTCRGDIGAAKALFGMPQAADREFLRGLLLDANLEMLLKAKNDRDATGVARITLAIIKLTGMDKDNERPFDPSTLRDPIPHVTVFDPTQAGAKKIPKEELERQVNLLLDERRAAGVDVPTWTDVDYEPLQNEHTQG